MKLRAALTLILALFLVAVPCLSAPCALACDLATLHSSHADATDCPMHDMDKQPLSSLVLQGHPCTKLCVQQQTIATLCNPAHESVATTVTLYPLPLPTLFVFGSSVKQNAVCRSSSPPPLTSLRV